jgi:uncharacterized protein (DUF305 family)
VHSVRLFGLLIAAASLLLGGCGAQAPVVAPSAAAPAPGGAFNNTDVMFLQMSLEHIRQGYEVVRLAEKRAKAAEVRDLAAAMDAEWAGEADTMARWLTAWGRPLTADQDAGVHAGHGDLHSLRPQDIAELRATLGAAFDRTAMSMLVGHLHNSVEVTRLEVAGGLHPQAQELAAAMTASRQAQIQRMLQLIS